MIDEAFMQTLNAFTKVERAKVDMLLSYLATIELKKGDYFLNEANYSNKIAFVESGVLEMNTYKEGLEFPIDFSLPNTFVCDYVSYLTNEPATTSIVALTPCKLHYFLKENFEALCQTDKSFQKISSLITEHFFIEFAKRIRNRELAPKERYKALEKDRPHLLQQVQQYKIAAYLGVTPEWLSKIKAST